MGRDRPASKVFGDRVKDASCIRPSVRLPPEAAPGRPRPDGRV